MALSFSNRRQVQTSSSQIYNSAQHFVQKQHSFIESSNRNLQLNGRYLTRGLSVGRSYESLKQKLMIPGRRQKTSTVKLQKTISIDQDFNKKRNSKSKEPNSKISRCTSVDLSQNQDQSSNKSAKKNLTKSFDEWQSQFLFKPIEEKLFLDSKKNSKLLHVPIKEHENKYLPAKDEQPCITKSSRTTHTANKISLNILLSQNFNVATEYETNYSDIESSSETPNKSTLSVTQRQKNLENSVGTKALNNQLKGPSDAIQSNAFSKRSQFQSNRNQSVNRPTSPLTTNAELENTLTPSPYLSIQRQRPPLQRAMSAPVRTLDENSKNNLFAANKKKSRRRKLVCRNISCDKSDNSKDFILDTENNSSGKKLLTRSRSVAAPDLVTLVSLVSSEGSESENDDDLLQTASGKSNENTLRRAPLLRKTGKSVSFQEHFTDNIQLSTKEYSMIRRGSIAPLAARLRANRPPTAPPVPVFINELNYADNMTTFNKGKTVNDTGRRKLERAKEQSGKENNGNTGENNQVVEYDFPPYVKSFKERECWKLYQKMIGNGVSVSYDTISRGMLTPTEFRQLQKQRECEEAKAREAEILNAQENVKK